MTPIDNADDLINSLMAQIEKLTKTVEINVNYAPSDKNKGWDEIWCQWYYCPACGGHNVAKGWHFCPECGAKINWIKEKKDGD